MGTEGASSRHRAAYGAAWTIDAEWTPHLSCVVLPAAGLRHSGSMAGDDCMSATLRAAATGAAAGAVGGAVKSNWGDVPLVLRNQAWPALKRTGADQHNSQVSRSIAFCTMACERLEDAVVNGGPFAGAIMRQYGLVLGFVGAAFAGTECLAESTRGAARALHWQ